MSFIGLFIHSQCISPCVIHNYDVIISQIKTLILVKFAFFTLNYNLFSFIIEYYYNNKDYYIILKIPDK